LNALLGAVGVTPQQAALAYQMAGVTNYNNNQTRTAGQTSVPGYLQNAGMDTDINAWQRILNPIREAINENRTGDLAAQQSMWAERAHTRLARALVLCAVLEIVRPSRPPPRGCRSARSAIS
jgi:hypothetical protein